ncbi:MAG: hypothetical protein GY855_08265 [candidate division Zixibacteria bacterium]|nr:hypothetical protein [candidate division Zixibacteria bacterium]
MGSRWFKYALGSMVLFTIVWISRINTYQNREAETISLTTQELYHQYTSDRDNTIDKYGGKKIEILGYVGDVNTDKTPFTISLNSGYDAETEKMIECSFWKNRIPRPDDFSVTQEVAIYGYFDEDQDSDWINLDYCKVIMF